MKGLRDFIMEGHHRKYIDAVKYALPKLDEKSVIIIANFYEEEEAYERFSFNLNLFSEYIQNHIEYVIDDLDNNKTKKELKTVLNSCLEAGYITQEYYDNFKYAIK